MATILNAADYYYAIDPRLKHELAPKSQAVEEWLPIDGHNFTGTIRKALEIFTEAPRNDRENRYPFHESQAKDLLNYLTISNRFDQDACISPASHHDHEEDDEDYCVPENTFGTGRRVSLETMRHIVDYCNR